MTESLPTPPEGDFLFYNTEDGATRIRLRIAGQTVWMPQKAIAELFDTSVQNIGQHIRNILQESELEEAPVAKDYFTTAADGKSYRTKHYALPMLLAIGYRVRSPRGTQFRRWATQTLDEYLTKGFALDDDRLKAAETTFGQDYFDELLARVRDIRASERRFYQKVTDNQQPAVEPRGAASGENPVSLRCENSPQRRLGLVFTPCETGFSLGLAYREALQQAATPPPSTTTPSRNLTSPFAIPAPFVIPTAAKTPRPARNQNSLHIDFKYFIQFAGESGRDLRPSRLDAAIAAHQDAGNM